VSGCSFAFQLSNIPWNPRVLRVPGSQLEGWKRLMNHHSTSILPQNMSLTFHVPAFQGIIIKGLAPFYLERSVHPKGGHPTSSEDDLCLVSYDTIPLLSVPDNPLQFMFHELIMTFAPLSQQTLILIHSLSKTFHFVPLATPHATHGPRCSRCSP